MDTQDAFKQIRQFAKYAEALALVCDTMDALAQSENTVKEHEARVATLRAEGEAIAAANSAARGEAEGTIAAANATAESITAAAHADAESIEQAARMRAISIGEAAQAEALEAEAKVREAGERAQAFALDVEIKAKELADIEDRAEKARAYLAKLAG